MNRLLVLAALAFPMAVGTPARAQELAHYLRLRHEYHVDNGSSFAQLHDAKDGQILEISGTVNGSFKAGVRTTLLLDAPNSASQPVDTDFTIDWLTNGIPARLLVKTIRPNESSDAKVVLLAAAKAEELDRAEAAATPAHPKRHAVVKRSRMSDPAYAGDGALYGPIGRGGTRLERREQNLRFPEVVQVYARFIRAENPRLGTEGSLAIGYNILRDCIHYGIDPRLVVSIMLVESGFDPASVSSKGAIGLGQLMPGTAAWMGVSNSFDVEQNIAGMVRLLRTLYLEFAAGSASVNEAWEKAIAAYNAGDGAVRRAGGIPPYGETQAYVRRVIGLWIRLSGAPSAG